MQIFHIKLSLEATKNIFINSLEEPAFRGLLRYEKRGLGLHYFQQFGGGGHLHALASSAEWIHDPIFVEYSRVYGTVPAFFNIKLLLI